jgi:hypothetical protein
MIYMPITRERTRKMFSAGTALYKHNKVIRLNWKKKNNNNKAA